MVLYNLTNLSNSTDIVQITNQLNILTDGLFISLFLFGLFLISYGMFSGYEIKRSLLAASVITTITSILFWSMNLVLLSYVTIPLVLMIVMILAVALED